MRAYETSAVVASSKERLWTVVADVLRWQEWTPTITRVVPLGSPFLGVGARFRIWQPRLYPVTWTVTELRRLESFTWEARMPAARLRAQHTIIPVSDDVCKVLLRFTFSGAVGGLIGFFYGPLTMRNLELEAQAIRHRLEEATSTAAGRSRG